MRFGGGVWMYHLSLHRCAAQQARAVRRRCRGRVSEQKLVMQRTSN